MLIDILNVKAWAMESGYFDRVHPIAYHLLANGQDLSKLMHTTKQADLFPTAGWDDDSGLPVQISKENKKVARIAIMGGLTKNGGLCAYGMRHFGMMIERANRSQGVDSILLEMDTPGGSVDGTEELGQAVKDSKKPVVVFGDSMVASAGYWIASQADHIMANKYNDTEFGSIGVLYVHENWAKHVEDKIGSIKIFRAPQSVDKARINPVEELTPEQEQQIIADLKGTAAQFITTVKSGRKGVLNTGEENIFTGKMYSRDQALAMGMIDSIGTREDAIEIAASLAESKFSNSSNNKNQASMKFPKISTLFGTKASEEITKELSAEKMAEFEAAEQKLADMEVQIANLQAQVTEKDATIASLTADNAALSESKTTLEAIVADQKAKLEAAPAGHATTVVKGQEAQADDQDKDKYLTSVDREKAELMQL